MLFSLLVVCNNKGSGNTREVDVEKIIRQGLGQPLSLPRLFFKNIAYRFVSRGPQMSQGGVYVNFLYEKEADSLCGSGMNFSKSRFVIVSKLTLNAYQP